MPYPFKLPTTSFLAFQDFVSSSSHPSLPLAASISRGVVRSVLKKHKRLPALSRTSHLPDVLAALNGYLPYLLAIDTALNGRSVADKEIKLVVIKKVTVEWRPVLTTGMPGREPARITLEKLEYEVLLTLSTLASTHYLIARSHLHGLYDAITPTPDQRATAVSTAMRHFLEAHAIYTYSLARASKVYTQPPVPDVSTSIFGALASLALADATLITVMKDDPYPAAVMQDRNKQDKDWMFKGAELSSSRALLFARLCLAAADHAGKGQGMLEQSRNVTESLPRYMEDLKKAARGKACRFLGIDAEVSGKTGEGIAWLRRSKKELGFAAEYGDEEKKRRGFGKLRNEWVGKREDRKIEKGGDWGGDAGRFDEGKVVDMLLTKWEKMNSIMNVQLVPSSETLLAKLPTGREYHSPNSWIAPSLKVADLARMCQPPASGNTRSKAEEEDSDDDVGTPGVLVGAFPDTASDHVSGNQYY